MKKNLSNQNYDIQRRCAELNQHKTFEKLYELTCSYGDVPAASWLDEDVEKHLTFNDLNKLTDNYASFFCNYFGTEGMVCISLDNCKEWFPIFWGLIRSGHDVLLVDVNHPDSMVTHIMEQANCQNIITGKPRQLGPQYKQMPASELSTIPAVNNYQPIWGKHVALCTSGTTSTIKIFVYDQKSLCYQVLTSDRIYCENRRFVENTNYKTLVFLPYHHVLGFSSLLLWSMFAGYTLVYLKNRTPKTIIQTAQQCKINQLITVPILVNNVTNKIVSNVSQQGFFKKVMFRILVETSLLLQHLFGEKGTDYAQKVMFRSVNESLLGTDIKCIILGGSHTPTRSLKILNALGYHTICGYGMTETAITSMETSPRLRNRLSGSVGMPLKNVEFKIQDGECASELLVKGECLHIGQLIDGRLHLRESKDGWYATGDIAKILPNKKQVFIEGRIKDVIINESGENVYPDEIEDFFSKLEEVNQYCILGLPKSKSENQYEDISLIVNVGDHFHDEQFIEKLTQAVASINYAVPGLKRITRALATSEELPVVNGFKTKRVELKKQILSNTLPLKELPILEQRFRRGKRKMSEKEEVPSPTGQQDTEMADLCKNILGIYADVLETPAKQIEPDDHFADDLGGDSLLMLTIINTVEEKYGIIIPTEQYPFCATVNSMAQVVYNVLHGTCTEARATLEERQPITRFEDAPEYKVFKQREEALIAGNSENPYFICNESPLLDTSMVNGHEVINFGSYNYVGMSGRAEVNAAAKAAIDKYGTSASGSRLLAGEKQIHQQLEKAIAEWKHAESALVCVSGHATNVNIVGNFCGKNDLILYDALAHNSIEQGCRLSDATTKPFPHNNIAALEHILKAQRRFFEKVLIVIEGAYSMDGDIADVPAFVALKKKYGCFLLVDEAHSACVIGEHGGGVDEYFHLEPDDIDIKMGTLSKGIGTCGGYLAGKESIINYLKYNLPGFVFSVGLSPALAAGALAAIQQLQKNPSIMENLHHNIRVFADETKKRKLDLCLAGETAILPIVIGKDEDAFRLSSELARRGIIVPPAVYPAVPKNSARLRFCVISEHKPEQIVYALDTLLQAARDLNIQLPERNYN